MTDGERLRTGIALSLFAHFLFFAGHWHMQEKPAHFEATVSLDMESPAAMGKSRQGFGVSSPSEAAQEEARLADMKRRAYLRYLQDVDDAIHARRFIQGGEDLIGVAVCSFMIDQSSRFSEPVLTAGSGDSRLDAAALAAVRAASGVVRRPKIIGDEMIPVTLQVKYQYGLR